MFEVAVKDASLANAYAAIWNSPFFTLPREVRDQIYGYCIKIDGWEPNMLNLRATCRMVSHEMALMFWDTQTAVFEVEEVPFEYWDELRSDHWPEHNVYPLLRNVKIALVDSTACRIWGGYDPVDLYYEMQDNINRLRNLQGVGLPRRLCEITAYEQDPRKPLAPNIVRSLQRLTDFTTVTLKGTVRREEFQKPDGPSLADMAEFYKNMLEPTLGPNVQEKWVLYSCLNLEFHPRAHWAQVEREVTEMMQRMFSEPGRDEGIR